MSAQREAAGRGRSFIVLVGNWHYGEFNSLEAAIELARDLARPGRPVQVDERIVQHVTTFIAHADPTPPESGDGRG